MKSSPPAAFLFDCDGTLFDTERLKARSWGRAVVQLVRARGHAPPPDLENRIVAMYRAGGTTLEAAQEIVRQAQAAYPQLLKFLKVDPLIAQREQTKESVMNEALAPHQPGAPAEHGLAIAPVWNLALAARRNAFPVGLVTTTEEHWVRRYFQASDLRDSGGQPIREPADFFDVVVCGQKKSNGIIMAVRHLLGAGKDAQLSPEQLAQFVMVEDSPEGTREARSTGVRVITIPNDFTRESFPHILLSQKRLARIKLTDLLEMLAE